MYYLKCSCWFATGTPAYLVELLKRLHYDWERRTYEETNVEVLNSVDFKFTNPISVI